MIRFFFAILDAVIFSEDMQDTIWFVKHSKQFIDPKTHKQYAKYLYNYPGAYYRFMKYSRADRKVNTSLRDW